MAEVMIRRTCDWGCNPSFEVTVIDPVKPDDGRELMNDHIREEHPNVDIGDAPV